MSSAAGMTRAEAILKLLALGPLTRGAIVEICARWDRATTEQALQQLIAQRAITWRNGDYGGHRMLMLPAGQGVGA